MGSTLSGGWPRLLMVAVVWGGAFTRMAPGLTSDAVSTLWAVWMVAPSLLNAG